VFEDVGEVVADALMAAGLGGAGVASLVASSSSRRARSWSSFTVRSRTRVPQARSSRLPFSNAVRYRSMAASVVAI
jgi:hypothetical protein